MNENGFEFVGKKRRDALVEQAPGGLGRLVSPDNRDHQYLMRTALQTREPLQLPPYRYYHAGGLPMNQGNTPQCVAYAWVGFLHCAPLTTTFAEGCPSPPVLYREAQARDVWPGSNYDGTSVRGGVKALVDRGHVAQYLWAYDSRTIAEWILSGRGTVVLGTIWTTSMSAPDGNGRIRDIRGPVVGHHAYLGLGANRNRKEIRFLNSWGKEWGDNGRFTLRYDQVDLLMDHRGEACTAVEQPIVEPHTSMEPQEATIEDHIF